MVLGDLLVNEFLGQVCTCQLFTALCSFIVLILINVLHLKILTQLERQSRIDNNIINWKLSCVNMELTHIRALMGLVVFTVPISVFFICYLVSKCVFIFCHKPNYSRQNVAKVLYVKLCPNHCNSLHYESKFIMGRYYSQPLKDWLGYTKRGTMQTGNCVQCLFQIDQDLNKPQFL